MTKTGTMDTHRMRWLGSDHMHLQMFAVFQDSLYDAAPVGMRSERHNLTQEVVHDELRNAYVCMYVCMYVCRGCVAAQSAPSSCIGPKRWLCELVINRLL